ncbi:putative NAD(P)H quinone oxidoreductase, PIG3 family [Micromonospora phaseoli]|uniref:Putative NAD(P)H quinone oxidoreductase, PIG3 family n=1 Tax=Micromonospora phaseoli TaxID=1144548 RepID=A0A1H7B7C2_9ACTN|nr:NAD(P)H-quinone oxidoreductase [Micromonospora phaseoli]PZV95190.1 putative PIG3 family NAD(P)H quinone oxidoreductase [Micromonospora phaseoli]GIJ79010.1 NAD(P)H quinone oxidoreductase [Micromonospora phaseoli]SEJ73046.1 putative NAD(P)H quinone oxidoreductase, PIG3 family [Micromonospora phaseoli]
MRAITIPEPGGPDVLTWSEVPEPQAGPGEVVVDVRATAVNRADLLQRQGHYPPPPGAPAYPGLECSGVVSAIGPDVADVRVGDQVCALLAGGGYAERVAVPVGQLLPVPAGVDLVDAAALPEVACTVWSNVVRVAGLTTGETLLVHGGGSGIGTFAIQLGAALGARVVATARVTKHDRLRELGADLLVDYRDQDFVEEVRRVTGGRGADVVLDIMGASYLGRNVAALATDGRLVVIGMQGGRRGELDLGALLAKRGTVAATALRSRPLDQKAAIVRGVRDQVWPLVEAGRVRPVVDRRLPITEAADAHRLVESNEHVGKVLLTVG